LRKEGVGGWKNEEVLADGGITRRRGNPQRNRNPENETFPATYFSRALKKSERRVVSRFGPMLCQKMVNKEALGKRGTKEKPNKW